jgi:hypothetical protein
LSSGEEAAKLPRAAGRRWPALSGKDLMSAPMLPLLALLISAPVPAGDAPPEPLLGLRADGEAGTVVFEVASNGCTVKADFKARLEGEVLTLLRTRRDTCKAMPERKPISFTLAELGLSPHKPFALGNRIVANP